MKQTSQQYHNQDLILQHLVHFINSMQHLWLWLQIISVIIAAAPTYIILTHVFNKIGAGGKRAKGSAFQTVSSLYRVNRNIQSPRFASVTPTWLTVFVYLHAWDWLPIYGIVHEITSNVS